MTSSFPLPSPPPLSQALLAYLRSGFNMDEYWRTLNASGVTRERLRSYDQQITAEPQFTAAQRDGLIRDLEHYLKSLKVRCRQGAS